MTNEEEKHIDETKAALGASEATIAEIAQRTEIKQIEVVLTLNIPNDTTDDDINAMLQFRLMGGSITSLVDDKFPEIDDMVEDFGWEYI